MDEGDGLDLDMILHACHPTASLYCHLLLVQLMRQCSHVVTCATSVLADVESEICPEQGSSGGGCAWWSPSAMRSSAPAMARCTNRRAGGSVRVDAFPC